MLFSQVIGQKTVQAQLLRMVQSDRLPHALLLLGPPGSGKRTLALGLAQYVLCESPGPDDACGSCRSCRSVEGLKHPDLHFSYPTAGPNAISEHFLDVWRTRMTESPYFDVFDWIRTIGKESNQGNITKDECVNIVRKVSLKAFMGKQKILVMWLPEFLGKEGNRLLKLIEEPPDNTLFILLAENPERILPTILSRCQIVRVGSIEDADVSKGLQEIKGLSPEQADTAALLADGNFYTALQLADNQENNYADMFVEWLRACHQSSGIGWVKTAERIAEIGREPQKYLITYGLHFLREALVHSLTDQLPPRLRGQQLVTAQKLMSSGLNAERIGAMSALLTDCHYHVERNANARILFLNTSIRLHRIMRQPAEAWATTR